jgi:hypothetical protein
VKLPLRIGAGAAPLVAGLAIGVLCVIGVSGYPYRPGTDDLQYIGLAFSFARGDGLVIPGQVPVAGWHFPPGWPLVLSWPFAVGFSPSMVALLAGLFGAACMGMAAALWAKLFARELGSGWGALAAIWPLTAYPVVLIAPSAQSEPLGALLFAALAYWVLTEPPGERRAAVDAVVLAAGLAAMVLLRTILIVLWLPLLWESRRRLPRRWIAGSAVAAMFVVWLVTGLTAVHPSGAGYLELTRLSWEGGFGSAGAAVLWSNWKTAGFVLAKFLISPLPFSSRLENMLGQATLLAFGTVVALGLIAGALLAVRRGRLGSLVAAPFLLAVPFLAGYPFWIDTRFIVPACALLGFVAVTGVLRLPVRSHRAAGVLLCVWIALGSLWWARLARDYPATQRATIEDAAALAAELGPGVALCAEEPEVLWWVDRASRSCRLLFPRDWLVSGERRLAWVEQRLAGAGPECVVYRPTYARGVHELPLAALGYPRLIEGGAYDARCAAPTPIP